LRTETRQAGVWSTDPLPAGLRAAAAHAMLNAVHLPWALRLGDRDAYSCRMRWHGLGNATVIACESGPLRGSRTQAEIAATDGDYMGLLLVLEGREHVRQGDRSVRLGAGDMLLWDAGAPLDFEVVEPLRKMTLLIPRQAIARTISRAAPAAGIRGANPLNGRSGVGALLFRHVVGLGRYGDQIPAADGPLAADFAIDLLGRLLAPSADPKGGGDLRDRVLRHVEDRLQDPGLTPKSIAVAFDITPRYLHMVFAGGTTLSAHIRGRRLARMRRDLDDPRLDTTSITDIALRWGFADSAHASRAFRQAFGQSPRAYRRARS